MDQPIPVICDLCRAKGQAGDDPFADLADLLSFTPVPRRSHVNGWDAETQRAFIAALAVTGSPRRAARALGRHAFGVEQLRKARGGASFSAAWDAAMELSRERELAVLKEGLAELAADHEEDTVRRRSALLGREQRAAADGEWDNDDDGAAADRPAPLFDRHGNEQFTEADGQDYEDGMRRVQDRLTRSRRLLLGLISTDPAKRAAWETLVGPADWDAAARFEAQADEPFATEGRSGHWQMRSPDMLMVVEAGFVPDLTGGKDGLAPIRTELVRLNAAKAGPPGADLPPEDAANIAAYRAQMIANGWVEDEDGSLLSPDPPSAAE